MSTQPPNVRDLPEPPEPSSERPSQDSAADERSKPPTASTRLVELALKQYRLGRTGKREAFARPATGAGQHVALELRGGALGLRERMAADYYASEGKVPPSQALADALATLEGMALAQPPTELHLRIAEADGATWVDLGDDEGRAVEVRDGSWRVVEACPVLFRRTELTTPMPVPQPGGDLGEFFQLVNVAPADRPTLVAAMVAAFMPEMPHPIITLAGEQGTGKSTAAELLVSLLDPSEVPLRPPPRQGDSFTHTFTHSWVVALDNLSTISETFSDSLCRIATGDGVISRKLYTNNGVTALKYRRQLILTGIDFAALRSDLGERVLLVELQRIDDGARQHEQALRARWDEAHPRILGALLTVLANVLVALPSVVLESMPRMADYARVLAAVDALHGTQGLERFLRQSAKVATDTLSSSPFTEQLHTMRGLDFHGTAADLLETVVPADPEARKPQGWPRSAREATSHLKRAAPALRKSGWSADDLGNNRDGTKVWHLVHPDATCRH